MAVPALDIEPLFGVVEIVLHQRHGGAATARLNSNDHTRIPCIGLTLPVGHHPFDPTPAARPVILRRHTMVRRLLIRFHHRRVAFTAAAHQRCRSSSAVPTTHHSGRGTGAHVHRQLRPAGQCRARECRAAGATGEGRAARASSRPAFCAPRRARRLGRLAGFNHVGFEVVRTSPFRVDLKSLEHHTTQLVHGARRGARRQLRHKFPLVGKAREPPAETALFQARGESCAHGGAVWVVIAREG
mmetsp:Transcript_42277/g.112904  ORF Transcript_42277/g.112904 Transcript_42277/m.112904 type:complete len:243 (-) Transcript_42277:203-931(-)